MSKLHELTTCNLNFTYGTVYKDLRNLGGNAYRDIKMSLTLGTSSDLVYYLKKHSKLLKGLNGDEVIEPLFKGTFSSVYLLRDHKGRELVVKRSHDGWLPLQVAGTLYIPIPDLIIGIFFDDFRVNPISLKRDVYDYEKIIKPFWGERRVKLESRKFSPYLNMGLHMVDYFLPDFSISDIYSKVFWKKLLSQKRHKNLAKLESYIKSIKNQKSLIPEEERYILSDAFSNSLQTIFIQQAVRGKKEIIRGKRMAFPFELLAEGVIPREMPKYMIEHILRAIESFVNQFDYRGVVKKVPDFRPLDNYKVFPPTPYEIYFAETNNLVVSRQERGKIDIKLVDTHLLLEPEGNIIYRWVERRYWVSLFLNLRFWIKKALDTRTN